MASQTGGFVESDLLNLVYIRETEGVHEVDRYWHQVINVIEHQKQTFLETVTEMKIAVLSFAFRRDRRYEMTPVFAVRDMLLQGLR